MLLGLDYYSRCLSHCYFQALHLNVICGGDMDLQIERNIEELMRLVGGTSFKQSQEITFHIAPNQFHLNVLTERLVLSSVAGIHNSVTLPLILKQCHPQSSYGVVQRIFITNNQLYVNCELPIEEGAYFWWDIVQWQQKLLINLARRK